MTTQSSPDPIATPRVAAGVLFFNSKGYVLLVEPTYKPYLDIPGGYVMPGESPLAAAVREVQEELGITPPIGELLAVDWAPHPDEGDKILFIFDGGTLSGDWQSRIRLQDTELGGYHFHDTPALNDVLIPRLANRVTAAIEARGKRSSIYLEHGHRRSS